MNWRLPDHAGPWTHQLTTPISGSPMTPTVQRWSPHRAIWRDSCCYPPGVTTLVLLGLPTLIFSLNRPWKRCGFQLRILGDKQGSPVWWIFKLYFHYKNLLNDLPFRPSVYWCLGQKFKPSCPKEVQCNFRCRHWLTHKSLQLKNATKKLFMQNPDTRIWSQFLSYRNHTSYLVNI